MFVLNIETTNAAFVPDRKDEVSRILTKLTEALNGISDEGPLHDTNGNRVGSWSFTTSEVEDWT